MSFTALMNEVDQRQHRPRPRGVERPVHPEPIKTPAMVEREAAYYAVLKLVARIDDDLSRNVRHYRNRAGKLLTTLDEVTRAISNDDLLPFPTCDWVGLAE